MSPTQLPSQPPPSIEATVTNAYRWLLILGFPADTAAASLMPELFTNEARAPETRPGSIEGPVVC